MSHLPRVERTWSIGSVIAAGSSLLGSVVIICGLIWGYAGVTFSTQSIPKIQAQQEANKLDIAVLKTQQANSDARYSEILSQLSALNTKLDRLNEQKADKNSTVRDWQR